MKGKMNLNGVLKMIFYNVLMLLLLLMCIDPLFKKTENLKSNINRSVLLKEHKPNIDEYHMPDPITYMPYTENLVEKKYRLRTDQNGFIIGENEIYTDSIEMIFWGGSTTECLYVDEQIRFPYLVGKKIKNIKTNQFTKILNGGVSGNNSLHSSINLLAKGIPLKPKVVVLMHNINDLTLLVNTGDYWKAPVTRSIIQYSVEKNVNNSFGERTKHVLKSIKDLIAPNIYKRLNWAIVNRNNDFKPVDEFSGLRNNLNWNYKDIENMFEKSLSTFIEIAQLHGIHVVLMTQFNRLNINDQFVRGTYRKSEAKIDYELYCQYYRDFNEKIREVSKKNNIPLIDLAKLVPSDKKYIYDAVHLNNAGSEFVANIISNELIKIFPDNYKQNK